MVEERAGLDAEVVDAAHVAEHSLTDFVDVVVADLVVVRRAFAVAPDPAVGDAGVDEVVDVVVGEAGVAGVANPRANTATKDFAAAMKVVVVDDIACGEERVILHSARRDRRAPDADAASAEIEDFVLANEVVEAAVGKAEGITADMRDSAIKESAIAVVVPSTALVTLTAAWES